MCIQNLGHSDDIIVSYTLKPKPNFFITNLYNPI